jgi:hypothetical protein
LTLFHLSPVLKGQIGTNWYRVNDPSGPDGKRQRMFFETREDSEDT